MLGTRSGRRRKMIVEKDDKRILNETYMVKAFMT